MKQMTRLAAVMASATALAFASFQALCAPTLDTTFGGTGIVVGPASPAGTTSFPNEGLLADRLEGVVFVRETNSSVSSIQDLVRLKANGNVDIGFGTGGAAPVAVFPAGEFVFTALAPDRRRILVAYGTSTTIVTSFSVRRYSEDGAADATFGAGGVATVPAEFLHPILDVQAQSDRKVLVVGSSSKPGGFPTQRVTLWRLTEAGALDATFGTGGVVYTEIPGGTGTDRGTGLRVQPDGKIVVAGRSQRSGTDTDAIVVRYLPDGTLDASFGSGGIAIVSFGDNQMLGRRLSIQPDGKIVVTGTVFDPAGGNDQAGLFRLNADGTLDVGFGSAGTIMVPLGANGGGVFELVQQPDDRPVVVGNRYRAAGRTDPIAIALRYTAFGTLDTTWDGDGLYELLPAGFTQSNGISITIDDRDRIVISGAVTSGTDIRWFVARLKTGPRMECRP